MIAGMSVPVDVEKTKAAIESTGLSRRKFCERINMDPMQLSHILRRGRCRVDLLRVVEDGLGLGYGELTTLDVKSNKPLYYRHQKGWSIKQLAEISGVPHNTIERLERGAGDCRVISAACLARALGIPMGVYLGYE